MGQNKEERPLVTWGQIAAHLGIAVETAQKNCKGAPVFMLGNRVAIYPSRLKEYLENQ